MTTNKTKSLGEFIKSWRLGEEMTPVEFAKILGISKQRVNDLEHNRYGVSIEMCKKIAQKIDLPAKWLIKIELQYQLDKEGVNLKVS